MQPAVRAPCLRTSKNSPSTHYGEYANRGRRTIPKILYAREATAYPRLSASGFAQAGLGGFSTGRTLPRTLVVGISVPPRGPRVWPLRSHTELRRGRSVPCPART